MSSIAFITGENGHYTWTVQQEKPYTGGYIMIICYCGRQYVKKYYPTMEQAKKGLKYYLKKEGIYNV